MQSNVAGNEDDPIDPWCCYSKDGRDLIADWEEDKKNRSLNYHYASNNQQLWDTPNNTEFLLGIFANGHLKMDWNRDRSPSGMPSLSNMTEAALGILKKHPQGYFLMVNTDRLILKGVDLT